MCDLTSYCSRRADGGRPNLNSKYLNFQKYLNFRISILKNTNIPPGAVLRYRIAYYRHRRTERAIDQGSPQGYRVIAPPAEPTSDCPPHHRPRHPINKESTTSKNIFSTNLVLLVKKYRYDFIHLTLLIMLVVSVKLNGQDDQPLQ